MPYLIVFLLALLFTCQYDIKRHTQGKETAYFILFLAVVLLAGCRYVVGGDTVRLMRYWENFPTLSDDYISVINTIFEPLWSFLNITCKSISDDFVFFQFVHAILLNGILFYGVFKKQEYFKSHRFTVVFFYMVYYLLYFNMEVMQEALAIALFLLSLPYYQKKKWIKYYSLAAISFLVHASAVVVFFIPYFRNRTFKLRYVIVVALVIGAFSVTAGYVLSNWLGPQIYAKFELYKEAGMNINGRILRIIEFIIIPLIVIHINDVKLKKRFSLYANFYMAYFYVAAVSIGNTAIGGRFLNYVALIMIGYYVYVLYNIARSRYFDGLRNLMLVLFIAIPLVRNYQTYFKDTSNVLKNTKNYFHWYPYTSVFQKGDEDTERLVLERIYYADKKMSMSMRKN